MIKRSSKSWFRMRVRQGVFEINVYDDIGVFGVTSESFRQQLDERPLGMPVRVRINSQGGDPFTAVAIFNMLQEIEDRVEVVIDGIAASAASIITMAGHVIKMPENAMLMIHGASRETIGDADDMRDAAEALDKVNALMARMYADRSGLPIERVMELMDAETFMTAQEAVELGFADEVVAALRVAAQIDSRRYGNPPVGGKGGSAATAREGHMTTKTEKAAAETPEQMEARIRAEVKAQMDTEAETARQEAEAAAAAEAGNETAEQIEARVRDGIVAEAKQINAICVLAGVPERAAAYVAEGKKLADVVASLEADAAAGKISNRTQGEPINARMQHGQGQGNGQANSEIEARLDPAKIYTKWNGRASA